MLEKKLGAQIAYICYKLEFTSMSNTERARLKGELSKLIEGRRKYREVMEQYEWTKESLKKKK